MCGVGGILSFHAPVDPDVIERMNRAMAHRGPDSRGSYLRKRIGLTHTRLAIVDLEGGRQPLLNEDRSVVLVSSGEIYNHVELRGILADLGHRFATRCDAEVILHAYEQWGEAAWERFNGMFAFALWDEPKETLFLVRDRIGIKPLYYHLGADRLVFASEIKAILQDETVPCAPDPGAVAGFFTFQNLLGERTFFRSIHKLLPGQCLRASRAGTLLRAYWDMEFGEEPPGCSARACVEEFREILGRSVRRHLMADVPVGSFLSGGFDSSAVALTAAESRGPMSVFTAAYDEGADYDERACARETASRIGARIHEVVVTPQDYRDHVEDVIYHLDEPAPGSAGLGHYMVSGLAAKRVKVVLTGHGGDELLAGYHVYKSAAILKALMEDPGALPRLLLTLRRDEIGRTFYFLAAPLLWPEARGGLVNLFPRRDLPELFTADFLGNVPDHEPMEDVRRRIARKQMDPYQKVFYLYLRTYLPSLLIQEDKLGMAHSIEARTPLLDNEMVDFAIRTPLRVKLHRGELKHIAKSAMRGRLPDALYRRPKMGFPTPFARWFRKDLWDMLNDILLGAQCRQRGIWRSEFIRRLLEGHRGRSGETLYDYLVANRIHSILSAELWCRAFLDRRGRRQPGEAKA